jgi:hypothetical protein
VYNTNEASANWLLDTMWRSFILNRQAIISNKRSLRTRQTSNGRKTILSKLRSKARRKHHKVPEDGSGALEVGLLVNYRSTHTIHPCAFRHRAVPTVQTYFDSSPLRANI